MGSGSLFQAIIIATAVGGVAAALLAVVALRHRDMPASLPFAGLAVVTSGWAFSEVLYLLANQPAMAAFHYRILAIASATIAPLWLIFAIVYTGRETWITPGRVAALLAPFATNAVLYATPMLHDLAPISIEYVTASGITAPVATEGVLGQATLILSYVYILVAFALLGQFFVRSRNVYRNQTAAIVLAGLFPTVGNVAYHFGFVPHPGIDLSPALLSLTVLVTAFALYRYDFLEVTPIVGDVLVDELPEPVLVLDESGEILDFNPAATRLSDSDDLTDGHASDVIPGLADKLDREEPFTVDSDGMTVYDPMTSPIEDQYGNPHGTLVVLRDVTAQQRRLDQLEALQSATQQLIGARTETQVADIAVRFASDVLDQPFAVLLVYDESADALVPVAMTDELGEYFDEERLTVERDSGQTWDIYERGDVEVVDENHPILQTEDVPARNGLLVPLGEHGLMGIGTDADREYSRADEQFARILARTTETALTRVAQEQELRRSKRALERRKDQIEFFNGVLRHNIRNGMLVIDGHAHHLRDRLEDGNDELELIQEWCDDLTQLTEKVRAINETVTASESERLGSVNITSVLRDGIEEVQREHDITVEQDVDDEIVVEANELVTDVVESVLLNAVEHNDAADPTLEVSTVRAGDRVQVRVADNGPGISDEMKEQVFEKDMDTSQTAAGFGLYFVSVMMDLYGGTVWFEDNQPRGTEAILEFRLAGDATELEV